MTKENRQSQMEVEESNINVLVYTKGFMQVEFLQNSVLKFLTTAKFARKNNQSPY